MAEHRERSATLKHESDRACHETGDRCRGAYHRHQLTPMGNKMRQGAGPPRRHKKSHDAPAPAAPRGRPPDRHGAEQIPAREREDARLAEDPRFGWILRYDFLRIAVATCAAGMR